MQNNIQCSNMNSENNNKIALLNMINNLMTTCLCLQYLYVVFDCFKHVFEVMFPGKSSEIKII